MITTYFKYFVSFLLIELFSEVAWPQTQDNCFFDDSSLKLSQISTNTVRSDFGPSVIGDVLYFTTLTDNSKQRKAEKEFYDLYQAPLDKQGNAGKRKPLAEFSSRFHDGPVAWCEKTGELFITQNYIHPSAKRLPFQDEILRLKIVIAKLFSGKWIITGEFPFYSHDYSVGHPAISSSGDTLVFSSDAPGGYGETDLYYSVRKNGTWQEPVNLGPSVNTMEREVFPFITDNKFGGSWLVFSSNGRTGEGGLDLYYTFFGAGSKDILHLPKPINSSFDDFAMTIPQGADHGYFTSNRPGTGDDDIYRFTFKRGDTPKTLKKFRVLTVLGRENSKPVQGARVTSSDKRLYFTDSEGRIATLPFDDKDYLITASALGYADTSKVMKAIKDRTGFQKLSDRQPVIGDTIWMNVRSNQRIILKDTYFQFDKSDILPPTARQLDDLAQFMKTNPGYSVQIANHTEESSTEAYNMQLSQSRAQAMADYLVSKGIAKSMITAKGYVRQQPVHQPNTGRNLTPAERRDNRRTEIFITEIASAKTAVRKKTGKPAENLFTVDKKPAEKTTEGALTDSPTAQTRPFNYYLILASFTEGEKIADFLRKAEADGLKITSLTDQNITRIGIGYNSREIAIKAREIFKDKYKNCWILAAETMKK